MKLRKTIAALAIIGAASLFAAGISDVSILVEKINATKDVKVKTELMAKLDKTLLTMKGNDLAVAQKIINLNLHDSTPVKK